jgi:hemolysin activation/secretion protein
LGFAGTWEARLLLDAQISRDALIPGEQFGLGGMNSVRGFEERALAADSGARLSAELWAPPVPVVPGLRFLVFLDSGYKHLEATVPGERSADLIASAGLGARWQWREYLSLSLDYGHVLDRAAQLGSGADRGNVRWHLNLLFKY